MVNAELLIPASQIIAKVFPTDTDMTPEKFLEEIGDGIEILLQKRLLKSS